MNENLLTDIQKAADVLKNRVEIVRDIIERDGTVSETRHVCWFVPKHPKEEPSK